MSILSFLLFLLVAAACAWIADALVPGTIPGGFLVSAIVGVLGAWVGASMFGNWGPGLAGVPVLPAILGSALLIFLFSLLSRPWATRA
jgi:uncharacterized membrane protein YeaQ/YmgE (transglycosylase-associated protein family)